MRSCDMSGKFFFPIYPQMLELLHPSGHRNAHNLEKPSYKMGMMASSTMEAKTDSIPSPDIGAATTILSAFFFLRRDIVANNLRPMISTHCLCFSLNMLEGLFWLDTTPSLKN